MQHYQNDNRQQTPDYDSAATNVSRPTTSNYMLENEVNHEDIYDEYSQYDQNNYVSPPLASDSPNYDVDMEDFGGAGIGSRQATPQQQVFDASPPRSASGLRR